MSNNVKIFNDLINSSKVKAQETVTVSSTALEFLADCLAAGQLNAITDFVIVQAIGQGVSYTMDGNTTATAANGFQIAAGDKEVWPRVWAEKVTVIRTGASDATLVIQEMRFGIII